MSPTTGTEPASESEPGGDAAYTPFGAERRLAVTAAREAGELLRARFRRGVEVWEKGEHGDVVTDLDLAAERLIVRRIRQRFPRDRIRAEEAGVINGDGSGRSWLVDPLDGSNNVAIGLPAYVVGVALCVDDAPVIGVVYDPVTEQTWSAEAGAGAFGPRGRLTVAERPLPRSGPLLAWTQGHGVARDDGPTRALRTFLEARSRRMLQLWAPLLSWVMLARGDIDGFVGFRAEAIDLPAGTLLAAEAGLEVRTLAGDPFLGSLDGPDTARSFVAGRPGDLPHLLDLVARSGYDGREAGVVLDTH